MRIGIDIDDVITDTSSVVKKYIDKSNDKEISERMEEVMRGEMPTQSIKKFFDDNSRYIYKEVKVKDGASEVIQEWLDKGNEIYIITSRGNIRFKGSEPITLEFFKLNNIKYTSILFNSFEKAKICKDNNIDIMVDDSVKHCTEIAKEGIKSVLFTSIVNRAINTQVPRVNNWLELREKINLILDNR